MHNNIIIVYRCNLLIQCRNCCRWNSDYITYLNIMYMCKIIPHTNSLVPSTVRVCDCSLVVLVVGDGIGVLGDTG